MKRTLITLLIVTLSLTSIAQQQSIAKSPTVPRGYLEYKGCTENCPLIVFLHGKGDGGNGTTELLKVATNGLPKFIKNGKFNYPVIVLSPQQVANRFSWTGDVIPFIKWAIKNYPIDTTRIFLTGLSMGDGWSTVGGPDNRPNYIRALVPVSGKGEYTAGIEAAKFNLPVWAFTGSVDYTHTVTDGRRPLLPMVNVKPEPKYTIVDGGGHNNTTWDKVYDPSHAYYPENIYDWFLKFKSSLPSQPIEPLPEEVKKLYILNGLLILETAGGKYATPVAKKN